jgi:hypothetical protein
MKVIGATMTVSFFPLPEGGVRRRVEHTVHDLVVEALCDGAEFALHDTSFGGSFARRA